ncbi:hypothetical protein CALVIDRAFT_330161 [Calocera viscosa TUFC12733]|uniref:Uncharacterized protein n=1 Tax=Calocera viscosa (strain TUFC12733) TaxID=1330018 RepID=A0A167HW38_CALVF|nr:hypothetical protein CALVIDRAFT_330161 [Calocera viscosa TUFC12733]
MILETLTLVYQTVTQPLPLIAIPPLDIVGALRLSVALRQIRAILAGTSANKGRPIENELARNIWTNWTVVWGGETILCALLAQTPSFLLSPTYPLLFLLGEVLVYWCPPPPAPSLPTELPLSVLDAFTRVGLLTSLALGPVTAHPVPEVAQSPIALVLASTLLANGGFFLVSSASMLSSQGWKPATPNELKAWGWTAVDVWSAGLVTSTFAIMTRVQPWWSGVHDLLFRFYSWLVFDSTVASDPPKLNTDEARSICLVILMVLFAARAVWNHGSPFIKTLGAS